MYPSCLYMNYPDMMTTNNKFLFKFYIVNDILYLTGKTFNDQKKYIKKNPF